MKYALYGWIFGVLLLFTATPSSAQPTCADLYANPSGINANLGASGISPFDLANVPWQTTAWPISGSTLAGGSYYFGTLNANNFYQLSVAAGERVTIYVNDTIITNNFLRLNANGTPDQLTIVVRSNVSINNQAEINGLIFAAGSININNNDVIVGGIAANGSISVGTNTTVSRDDNAVAQLEIPGLCVAGSVVTPIPKAHYPLDLCEAANNSVIEDLMNNFSATGFALTTAEGKVNGAANFSSSGMNRVELPSALLQGTTDFSFSVWFKADASNSFRQILSASNNSMDTVLELYIRNNNQLRAGLLGVYYTFGSPEPVLNNNTWYHSVLTRAGNQLCLYLNGALVQCQNASAASLNVTRAALGVWWRANGSMADQFLGDMDEALFFNGALTANQIQTIYNNQNDGFNFDGLERDDDCLQCFTDTFSAGQLSDDWVTSRSSGNFTPSIVDGRLRMTQAVANQATSATYQRLFPAADNLVVVEFDYFAWSTAGGQGADGVAIILSDADVTPQPGSFGGSLGYAQRNNGDPGFAGGWLGIALDEFGNFSNQTEGRVGGIGLQRNAVAIRGSESSQYRYLAGTGGGLNPPIDQRPSASAAPNHRYRIVIDSRLPGQAVVSVERDIKNGNGFQTLINPFNALAIPAQGPVPENFFLSFTGSTGGSNNNHELDNISICALRSLPVGQQIDHFEFDHTGQALTCQPETLTIRACLNADCSQLYTDAVTATLSPQPVPGGEWVGGHVINFTGGSTTVPLRRSSAGPVTVGVTGSVPSTRPLSTTLCRAGGSSLNQANCTLNFASSGFIMDIPDGVAGVPDDGILLRAVREGNDAQACIPAFSDVTRNVLFWSDYIIPDASNRPASLPVQVDQQDAGMSNANALTLPLSFNQDGVATLTVNYSDAGRVQLNARYVGSVATEDQGLVMNGADQFSRRPYGLCMQSAGDCVAANASCPVFRRAGEPFELSISAHAWQSGGAEVCAMPVTPNYQQPGIALSHQLVAPSGGVVGSLSATSYAHQAAVNSQTLVNQSVSEVGVFRFQATPASNAYFGMTVPPVMSEPIGRFIPDRFELRQATVIPGCGNFSYMEQPFAVSLELEAKALTGQRTENYQGSFAPLLAGGTRLVAEQNSNGVDLTARLIGMTQLDWTAGEAVLLEQVIRFVRAEDGPDGPYPELAIGLQQQDADGVVLAELDMNTSSAANCIAEQNCHAKQLAAAQDLRFGRLQLANAFGPEFDPLPLQLTAYYWTGDRFSRNRDDQCSPIAPAQLQITGTPNITAAGVVGEMAQGQNAPQSLWLEPPEQSGVWELEYETDPWLQFNWSGGTNYDEHPQAEAIFGRYRGNPRRIFWREPFP
ncbi:LamG-like jellyroll fold domain-containing protein [Alkalimonas collagenimarina]|uniref:LamG-like jellyroll fold domain-containing protein n=1 Tax=Alkalimonas collagenimarina TaxID=400390 RepID=A0ABT9H396_9GAMM|nr:DUF6701 domain-containing protein [Alkalimonas collagenimarina]MDP4537757.1 LamG-like jellyroll fold domain-containing protein [Alkalimonas collagenimarina]